MRLMPKLMLCVMVVAASCAVASPARADKTADQAVWLLEQATLVHRNGRHNVLLRALRQMRDPRLEPLFSELVQRHHPSLRIHGILGMSEIADPPRLDLALVAELDDPATQAQLVSAAIDSDLLSNEAAGQLLRWPGLPGAVRVIVVSKLVSDGERVDPGVLDEAAEDTNPALRSVAAVLRAQLGEAEALGVLDRLDEEPDPSRQRVQALVLQTLLRHELDAAAAWTMELARAKLEAHGVGREDWRMGPIAYQALRAALIFEYDQAINLWMACFDQTPLAESPESEKLRLAMLALDLADRLDERIFTPMLGDEMPIIRKVGQIGTAIASGEPAGELIEQLIAENNKLASAWALQYAVQLCQTDAARARPILLAIARAASSDEPRFRSQRLQNAVLAVEKLHENDRDAVPHIRRLIASASTFPQEAMLMGLIRSDGERPAEVVAGIETFDSRVAEAMALLLKAKHAERLTEAELDQLSLIVRGGFSGGVHPQEGGLQEPLRIQAAWTYLRLTQQDRVALATVLGGRRGLP